MPEVISGRRHLDHLAKPLTCSRGGGNRCGAPRTVNLFEVEVTFGRRYDALAADCMLMIQPWPLLNSQSIGDFRVFRLRLDKKRSPRTGDPHEFYVLDAADWVNVVALTPARELIMVEQYRHGTNTLELEVPGGVMDPSDASPLATAVRELREETGYAGDNARLLGQIAPNPAIMSNTCFIVAVENCQARHPVTLDSGEDLLTRLVPLPDVSTLVRTGKIRHSIVLVALYFLDLWQRDAL